MSGLIPGQTICNKETTCKYPLPWLVRHHQVNDSFDHFLLASVLIKAILATFKDWVFHHRVWRKVAWFDWFSLQTMMTCFADSSFAYLFSFSFSLYSIIAASSRLHVGSFLHTLFIFKVFSVVRPVILQHWSMQTYIMNLTKSVLLNLIMSSLQLSRILTLRSNYICYFQLDLVLTFIKLWVLECARVNANSSVYANFASCLYFFARTKLSQK